MDAQDETVEAWDALRARRNVRQFSEQPVPAEALDRILEAGRRAPSAGNWQPWDFVLVTNRAQLVELAKVWQGAKHVAGAAAAIAIVAPEPQNDRQSALLQYDLGQATYAMTVAAADLGVGTGHAAAADQNQAGAVGFPEGRFLAYVLSVGYPSAKPLSVIERLNRRAPSTRSCTAEGGDRADAASETVGTVEREQEQLPGSSRLSGRGRI